MPQIEYIAEKFIRELWIHDNRDDDVLVLSPVVAPKSRSEVGNVSSYLLDQHRPEYRIFSNINKPSTLIENQHKTNNKLMHIEYEIHHWWVDQYKLLGIMNLLAISFQNNFLGVILQGNDP